MAYNPWQSTAESLKQEVAQLRMKIEALKTANLGLRERLADLEPFAVANANLLRARREAEHWLADEGMMEDNRNLAWLHTKGELKVAWTADNQPVIPDGWPADCTPEEAINEFVGLTRDGKRLANGEGGAELPEQVPSSGTFLHALAEKARITR